MSADLAAMLADLAASEGLQFEVEGEAFFAFDGDRPGIEITTAGVAIGLATPLFAILPEDAEAVFERALRCNLDGVSTGGGRLSLHPEYPLLELRRELPAPAYASGLGHALAEFITTARALRGGLGETVPADMPSAAPIMVIRG